MKNLRIPMIVPAFALLAAANVSAQTRIALTGGVSFARIEGDMHSFWQPGPASGFSAGLAAIMPTRGSFEFEFRGAYSWMGQESLANTQLSIRERTDRVSRVAFGNHVGLMALGRMNGLRNLTEVLYQGSDESARRRAVTVRAGLVHRIG